MSSSSTFMICIRYYPSFTQSNIGWLTLSESAYFLSTPLIPQHVIQSGNWPATRHIHTEACQRKMISRMFFFMMVWHEFVLALIKSLPHHMYLKWKKTHGRMTCLTGRSPEMFAGMKLFLDERFHSILHCNSISVEHQIKFPLLDVWDKIQTLAAIRFIKVIMICFDWESKKIKSFKKWWSLMLQQQGWGGWLSKKTVLIRNVVRTGVGTTCCVSRQYNPLDFVLVKQ